MDVKRVFKLSNTTYDKLKFLAQILLPALSGFGTAIGEIWEIPFMGKIVATILAANIALGAALGISTKNYNKEIKKVSGEQWKES